MKEGDKVRATWSDGLEIIGTYDHTERGYVVLVTDDGKQIACNTFHVKFEVIDLTGKLNE